MKKTEEPLNAACLHLQIPQNEWNDKIILTGCSLVTSQPLLPRGAAQRDGAPLLGVTKCLDIDLSHTQHLQITGCT